MSDTEPEPRSIVLPMQAQLVLSGLLFGPARAPARAWGALQAAGLPSAPGAMSAPAASCPLRLEAMHATPRAWRTAVSKVENKLRTEWDARDCARIDVVLDHSGSGAAVEFVTERGAHAGRHIAGPDELAPTVQALVTTLDRSLLAAGGSPSPAPLEQPQADDHAPAPMRQTPIRESPGLVFDGGLGARAGTATGAYWFSPVVCGEVALDLRRWELGVAASWEPSYRRTERTDDDVVEWSQSATVAGIVIGRREPIGSWDLTYGAMLLGALVRGRASEDDEARSGQRLDARVGAYVGTSVPRSTHVRFRALLTADFVPARIGQSALGPADLPWLMGMGFVGVEVGGP